MDPNSTKNLLQKNEEEDRSNSLMPTNDSNSKGGFEAQVQIQIGPNGGTITASRKRRENHSLQQMNADLIKAQTERKDKLLASLTEEKNVLAKLQQEIAHLRSNLPPLIDDLQKLKDENQRLRMECDLMTREVDLCNNGTVPLGETSLEFYRAFNPGQDAQALFGSTANRRRLQGTEPGGLMYLRPTNKLPPPRPPPPRHVPHRPQEERPTDGWFCSLCTFQNHPDLTQCEECSMVRVSISNYAPQEDVGYGTGPYEYETGMRPNHATFPSTSRM